MSQEDFLYGKQLDDMKETAHSQTETNQSCCCFSGGAGNTPSAPPVLGREVLCARVLQGPTFTPSGDGHLAFLGHELPVLSTVSLTLDQFSQLCWSAKFATGQGSLCQCVH